jgi:chemotaxis protein MotB
MELKNALLFDSGQADITPAGRAAIDKVVKLLPTIDQRYQIAIEGHTDDVPIHTARFDSNWDLSSGRAINVLKSFTAAGISAQRLSAQGYADTRPAANLQGDSASYARARSENRRVVIRVY